MIEEQYVSFEVAKLLKEKGFNEPTLAYAYCQGMISYYSRPKVTDPLSIEAGRIPLPTQQMAMRWLREVHHIHVCPEYKAFFQEKPRKVYHHWCCNAVGIDRYFRQGVQDIRLLDPDYFFFRSCKTYHDTYEDACEETIEYCLKHLID